MKSKDMILIDYENEQNFQINDYDLSDGLFNLIMLKRLRSFETPDIKKKKISVALLSNYTQRPIDEFLEFFATLQKLEIDVFLNEFGTLNQTILDLDSELYQKQFDYILLMPDLKIDENLFDLEESVDNFNSELSELISLINQRCKKSQLIVSNKCFTYSDSIGPFKNDYGVHDTIVNSINSCIRSNDNFEVFDLNYIASNLGASFVYDTSFQLRVSSQFSMNFLNVLAKEFIHRVVLDYQQPKKCIVLDLDNTLWGGEVGDRGALEVDLGNENLESRAYLYFQQFILSLKNRGLLLAISSKNEESVALEVFKENTNSILKLEDFSAIQIHWEPKFKSIHAISQKLNIGLDSIVFIDDNPMEIDIVKQNLPEVSTILLDKDFPELHIKKVLDSKLLNIRLLTKEDLQKTGSYKAQEKRKKLQVNFKDMNSYLKSLSMKILCQEVQESDFERASQLINKTNQFNLTTIRRSLFELKDLVKDQKFKVFTVSLSDRFENLGIISVVILEIDTVQRWARIDTWVLSCRAFGRMVEQYTMNHLFAYCSELGVNLIKSKYIKTEKNMIVSDIYLKLGFEEVEKVNDPYESKFFRASDWKMLDINDIFE